MRQPHSSTLFALYLYFSTAIAVADNALTVHATEANSQITPRDPGQSQTILPALDISVLAEINCLAGATAESVTVSVADTHVRFGVSEIADASSLEASLRVPADQLAPIAAAGFCIKNSLSEDRELLMPAVASAQVSLRCRNDNRSSVHFASVPLPLRLGCDSGEDQDSSSDK